MCDGHQGLGNEAIFIAEWSAERSTGDSHTASWRQTCSLVKQRAATHDDHPQLKCNRSLAHTLVLDHALTLCLCYLFKNVFPNGIIIVLNFSHKINMHACIHSAVYSAQARSHSSAFQVSRLCCDAVSRVFQNDIVGEVSLEVIRPTHACCAMLNNNACSCYNSSLRCWNQEGLILNQRSI